MGFRGSRVQIHPSRSVEVSARPLVIGAWHCRFVAEFPGAFLKDPARLFNSSLDGNVRRAIDIHEGEKADAYAASRSGRRGRYGKNVEWMQKVSDEQYRR